MKPSRRNKERAAIKAEKRQGGPPRLSKYAAKNRAVLEPVPDTAMAAALKAAKEKVDG